MTTKQYILEELQKAGENGLAGGIIEDRIRELTGAKASTTSRRCRELYEDGFLQRHYSNGYVIYRIRQ